MRMNIVKRILILALTGSIIGYSKPSEKIAPESRAVPDQRQSLPDQKIDLICLGGLHEKEAVTSTHPELIRQMLQAIAAAHPDPGVYDSAKNVRLDLCRRDAIVYTLYGTNGFYLFDFQGKQYCDGTETLARLVKIIRSGMSNTALTVKPRYQVGETVQITWTIRNYSKKPILLPIKLKGELHWSVEDPKQPGNWIGNYDKWFLDFTINGSGPIKLEPDKMYQYSFSIPSKQFKIGKIGLQVTQLSQETEGSSTIPAPDEIMVIIQDVETKKTEAGVPAEQPGSVDRDTAAKP